MDNTLYSVRKWMVKMGIVKPEDFESDNPNQNNCYICNGLIETTKCNNCKIDFNDIFICPYLNDEKLNENKSKICNITNKECKIMGIEYESCENYHSIDSD